MDYSEIYRIFAIQYLDSFVHTFKDVVGDIPKDIFEKDFNIDLKILSSEDYDFVMFSNDMKLKINIKNSQLIYATKYPNVYGLRGIINLIEYYCADIDKYDDGDSQSDEQHVFVFKWGKQDCEKISIRDIQAQAPFIYSRLHS